MRILHVTTEFPWPATSGGTVRTKSQLQILCSLPEVTEVTMLTITETRVTEAERRELGAAIPKLRVLPSVFHPIHLFDFKRYVPKVALLRAFAGVPYLAGKWDSRAYRAALRRELAGAPVDVVYIDHLGLTHYLRDVKAERPHARTVMDQHNVESDFFRQFAEKQKGLKRLVAKEEARVSVKFERKALESVDAVVAISDQDAKDFEAMAGVKAHVVPVVMAFDKKPRPVPKSPHFCYVGNLRWAPNVAGLDWFCEKVWPRVRARVPDATIEIAGIGLKAGAPTPEKWRGPGLEVIGFLEDLEPLYDRSLAMLAPVQGGAPGVRMKLLEGFRAGMPICTTPDGAFGLPLRDGEDALISNDPDGFADRIARLANEPDLRARLREAGFRWLETHNSLPSAQAVMRRVLGLPEPR